MKMGMSIDEIMKYISNSEETSIYLNNILKKYPDEFYGFLDKVVEKDTNDENVKDLEQYTKNFQEFALELIIQRLRQLNCFGNPGKEYVKNVFDNTLKEIFR